MFEQLGEDFPDLLFSIFAENHFLPIYQSRSMSEAQESAQLLAGPELPTVVLEALLENSSFSGKVCGIVNLAPYDGHLEKVCVKWKLNHGADSIALRSMSLGLNVEHVSFSERIITNDLLQDLHTVNLILLSYHHLLL